MPELAKVLRFPAKQAQEPVSSVDALRIANEYLSTAEGDRSASFKIEKLSYCDVLLAICKTLRDSLEAHPAVSAVESSSLYRWVLGQQSLDVVFDEREYILGETALIAAKASRFLGSLVDAERWLDRSEAAFRHTVNPAPSLASVTFERVAIRFASGRFEDTLELLPSLKSSFKKLGMSLDHVKTQFLEAVTLRAIGDAERHFEILLSLDQDPMVQRCPSLHGQVLVHMGNHEATLGDFEAAARTYEKALPIVLTGTRPVALCELKWAIADAYRGQGSLVRALESYRAARTDYQDLGFGAFVIQLSLVIAETLLALKRDREAEWEILSTLPTIDEKKMVPEGLAAMSLLRESVRRRMTDSNALRELREHLQAGA
jgi:tetratricopeptide (TPR) repeat protein